MEQWNGQPSHAISDFSPAGSKTSGLEQQVRTTSGLAAPPQFSPFIHSGLQRSFSTTARSDMIQRIPMAATLCVPYHPSPMPSPGYQTPVPSMVLQGTDKAAMSVPCPLLNIQQRLALTSPFTVAAYPVTT